MTNETYDRLKWVALVLLPLLATFWEAFGHIWNIPYTEEITASIVAIDALLGGIVDACAKRYHKKMKEEAEVYYEEDEENGDEEV